ncbi:MAG: C1 family peptidase [Clostridiales bacterium]|nr:C1 family peptidase [Clostridiales bacterium]
MKKFISVMTAAALISACMPVNVGSADEKPDLNIMYVEEIPSDGGLVTQRVVDSEGNEVKPVLGASLFEAVELPESYVSQYSPVKNQGVEGCCWAFAAVGAAESSMLKKGLGLKDYSEAHLAYFANNSYDTTYGDGVISDNPFGGGNNSRSTAAMMKWSGLEMEEHLPYNAGNEALMTPSEDMRFASYTIIDKYSTISISDENAIKSAIMDYGAVTYEYYSNSSYYTKDSSGRYTYYMPPTTSQGNHMVTIVGWDDTYSAANFKNTPDRDGAWLAKNSWGEGWGSDGMFWISYASNPGTYTSAGIFDVSPNEEYDYVYTYTGASASSYFPISKTDYAANIYTAKSNEEISAVSAYFYNCSEGYDMYVYTDITGTDILGGTAAVKISSDMTGTGTELLKLDKPITVDAGEKFAVIIQPKGEIGVPVEKPSDTNTVTAHEGESFLNKWDMVTNYSYGNLSLNAYTKAADEKPTKLLYAVDELSAYLDLCENNTAYAKFEGELERAKSMTLPNAVMENNEIIYLRTLASKLTFPEVQFGASTAGEIIIEDAQDLIDFAASGNSCADTTVRLVNDIELDSSVTNNISMISTFRGVFDGGGHRISGVNISNSDTQSSRFTGLFQNLYGTVKNLEIEGTIEGTASERQYVGAIARLGGTVENCRFDVTVKASSSSSYCGAITYSQKLTTGVTPTVINSFNTTYCSSPSQAKLSAIVATAPTGHEPSITNSYYINSTGYTSSALGGTAKTASELKGSSFTSTMNTNLPAGDNPWHQESSSEYPTMKHYTISNANELKVFAQTASTKFSNRTVSLMADIELDERTENNISEIMDFRGIFDGNGHTISGVNISQSKDAGKVIGLFHSVTASGTIKNLEVKNAKISSTAAAGVKNTVGVVGALFGTVENCRFEADMTVNAGSEYGVIGVIAKGCKIDNFYTTSHTMNTSGVEKNGIFINFHDDPSSYDVASTVTNCYAKKSYSNTAGASYITLKTEDEIKAAAFTTLMNTNRGSNMLWSIGSDGSPTLSTSITYTISTAQELKDFAQATQNGNTYDGDTVILDADIELDGQTANNIGEIMNFYGTFDGNGHTISGVNISRSKDAGNVVGLFNSVNASGTIKNLEVKNAKISSTADAGVKNTVGVVGALFGTVENCRFEADMTVNAGSEYGVIGVIAKGCKIDNFYTTSHTMNTSGVEKNGIFINFHDDPSSYDVASTVINCYAKNSYSVTAGASYITLKTDDEMKAAAFTALMNEHRGTNKQWYQGSDSYPTMTETTQTPTPAPTATPIPTATPAPTQTPTPQPVSGTSGDITWEYDRNGTLTFSGNGSMEEKVMPGLYPWSAYSADITRLVTMGNITAVGRFALGQYTALSEVTLGAGLGAINDYAFAYCTSLKAVTIPRSVTSIAEHAFDGCSSDLVIYCPASSTALEYAKAHGIKYQIITTNEFDATAARVDNKVVITANIPDDEITKTVHAAIYNSSGELVDYIAVPAVFTNSTVNIVFNYTGDMSTAKVFLWNTLETMTPITAAIPVKIG